MNEVITGIIIGLGILFDLFGCIGLVRFPDVYTRLQASTKCVTLGTALIVFGVFIYEGFTPAGIKALLVMLFILATSPTSAHALARGAYRSGIKPEKGYVVDKYQELIEKEERGDFAETKNQGTKRGI